MKSKLFQKKLKILQLEKLFSNQIIIILQTNFQKTIKENKFFNELFVIGFHSKKVSTIFFTNFFKKKLPDLSNISSNALKLIVGSTTIEKKNFLNLTKSIFNNKNDLILKILLFSQPISSKNLLFFLSHFFNLGLKKVFYKLLLKINFFSFHLRKGE